MSNNSCIARIRGLPDYPHIREVNVRTGPTTNVEVAFRTAVGTEDLRVIAVAPDSANNAEDGKIYQWFHLDFNDGRQGWVRDDLLEIQGNCGEYGYGMLAPNTFAFEQTRGTPTAQSATTATTVPAQSAAAYVPVPESAQPTTDVIEGLDRVKKAAFMVTAAFEGTGYAAYNNYDAGIISYGLIQFTMAAGSLITVMEKYLDNSQTDTANQLRGYLDRMRARDETLRQDVHLKNLLIAAADEVPMKLAQDEVATVNYWDKVVSGYITHRELKTPLAYALLFDMGVNFGTGHGFVRKAEEELGVPSRSKPGENGITEEQLITKVAELRKASHYRQADRDNLPGLKVRGDFWVDRCTQNDWDFVGDANGFVNINGRRINVLNP